MTYRSLRLYVPTGLILTLVAALTTRARTDDPPVSRITTPKAHFGFNLGEDYCLANYEQYAAYLARLEKESDRTKVVNIGETAERRPQLMAIVTSPVNHKKLPRLREIAGKLANAEGITADDAARLYGPQVLFRAQPHGTFRLVFNALVRAGETGRS